METKYYPTFVLAKKIRVGNFLERLEAILAFLWIVTTFFKSLVVFYGVTKTIAQLLQLRESQMLTIPLGMLMLVGSVLSSPNIAVYNRIVEENWPWFDYTFCVLLPFLLLAVSLIRGKGMAGKG